MLTALWGAGNHQRAVLLSAHWHERKCRPAKSACATLGQSRWASIAGPASLEQRSSEPETKPKPKVSPATAFTIRAPTNALCDDIEAVSFGFVAKKQAYVALKHRPSHPALLASSVLQFASAVRVWARG
jgi:hypothetical protein